MMYCELENEELVVVLFKKRAVKIDQPLNYLLIQ
jgi:hypothetical protein